MNTPKALHSSHDFERVELFQSSAFADSITQGFAAKGRETLGFDGVTPSA